MKKTKRLISLLLVLVALSVFSVPAFADSGDGSDPQGTTQRSSQPTPPPNLPWWELVIWYATHGFTS